MFRITIEELEHLEGEKYPARRDIYHQEVEDLDIPKLIEVVNEKLKERIKE